MKKYLKTSICAVFLLSVFFSCRAELNNTGDPYSSSYKKDKNSLLQSLLLSKGSLTPAFDTNVEDYTAGVNNNIESITLTPVSASQFANIKINDMDVASGEASPDIDLNVGNNTITIVVTAEDTAYYTIYTIDMYRAVAIPKTGQTSCYYYDTGSGAYIDDADCSETYISCCDTYPAGQDGQLQKGVEWPNPRFTSNMDNTISDNLTGLIWIYTASTFPEALDPLPYTWDEALSNCNNLRDDDNYLNDGTVAGDWRLPNINEIRSIFHYGVYISSTWLTTSPNPFTGITSIVHSSTTIYKSKSYAFGISMEYGQIFYNTEKSPESWGAWAVKSGSPGVSNIIKTGLTKCYDSAGSQIDCEGTGQDGEYQTGIEPPETRFIDNGDGTISDRLTGLMWEISPLVQVKTWDEALAYANNLTLAGHDDWRLPNINELSSIQNAGVYDVVTWLLGQGFVELEAERYFSSTTYSYEPDRAWTINFMNSPATEPYFKTEKCYVIAVRDAE